MDIRPAQAEVLRLLEGSPIASRDVAADIRQSVAAGEVALALDTLCSWIFEDSSSISREYFGRLAALAAEIGLEKWIGRLEGLVQDG